MDQIKLMLEILVPIFSVGSLGWWLSGRFRKIEITYQTLLNAHETRDQARHEENLERFRGVTEQFGDIKAALAQLGYGQGRPRWNA